MLHMGVGSLGQSLSQPPESAPRYLFLLPFLILALGLAYWSGEIKKSAIAATHVDNEQWHQLSMDKKVSPSDPPVEEKPIIHVGIRVPALDTNRNAEEIGRRIFGPPPPSQPTPPPPSQPTFSSSR
jgi:hypothetical protein